MAYHGDNAVTAWIKYNSTTATLNDDYGFSSISDQGTGNFILSFSTTMSNSDYAVAAGGGGGTGSLSDGSNCLRLHLFRRATATARLAFF